MYFLAQKFVIRNFSFIKKMQQNISSTIQRAQRVQQNVMMQNYNIQLQAKLRRKVDIQSSIDSLQKQMMQQIARSLRKSEDKIKYFIYKAQKIYNQLSRYSQKKSKQRQINDYNKLIDQCQKARWQFMVHRQSCGFTIKNHQLVHSIYKIPPKIIL